MNEAEIKQKMQQIDKLKEGLGSYFEKEELEVGVVISVLMSMLVSLMKDTDTPPEHAIMLFGTAVCTCYDDDDDNEADDDEKGVAQWLN